MQARQEVERRLQEKEEEFENTRKNFARAMDSMQASLEGESKAKQEALRQVVVTTKVQYSGRAARSLGHSLHAKFPLPSFLVLGWPPRWQFNRLISGQNSDQNCSQFSGHVFPY